MSSRWISNKKFFENHGGPNEAQLTYKLSDKECNKEVFQRKRGEVANEEVYPLTVLTGRKPVTTWTQEKDHRRHPEQGMPRVAVCVHSTTDTKKPDSSFHTKTLTILILENSQSSDTVAVRHGIYQKGQGDCDSEVELDILSLYFTRSAAFSLVSSTQLTWQQHLDWML